MARIELRDCTVRIKDGLGAHPDVYPCVAVGNKTLTPGKTAVQAGDTGCKVTSVSIPPAVGGHTEKIPVALASPSTVRRTPLRSTSSPGARKARPAPTPSNRSISTRHGRRCADRRHLYPGVGRQDDCRHRLRRLLPPHVKAALVAMDDGYTTDDWAVTGEAGAWVVEFKGALGGAPRALLVGDGTSLTGGGGVVKTVTVATTVAGVTAASSAVTTAITFSPALGADGKSQGRGRGQVRLSVARW